MNRHETPTITTRAQAAALDQADPLADMRDRFVLRDGLVYLDGNSLGAMPHAARERVHTCLDVEWGRDLIASWNTADWIGLPRKAGAKIAGLIGAGADDVVVTDSTSINLFKVLAAALALNPERRTIVSERANFPTDLYVAEGLAALKGQDHVLHLVEHDDDLMPALTEDVAVLMLTHVDYRTGRMLDMAAITQAAHATGILVVWDLAHSAGALPVDLEGAGADFAVGCGYKYLNGGPGAPAFVYCAPRHQGEATQPLSGWFAHAAPFAFEPGFRPAPGIDRFLTGTSPVLSLVALDAALDLWGDVDMSAVREKSIALCDLFIARVQATCPGLTLASPRDGAVRGSQVSFRHEAAYPIMQALIARGVVGDFRAPDILRFGFTPLYTRFTDAFDAAAILADILASDAWNRPEYHQRSAVT
ncbi:MAG: kynureninase [Pseudomonadota bacterium]